MRQYKTLIKEAIPSDHERNVILLVGLYKTNEQVHKRVHENPILFPEIVLAHSENFSENTIATATQQMQYISDGGFREQVHKTPGTYPEVVVCHAKDFPPSIVAAAELQLAGQESLDEALDYNDLSDYTLKSPSRNSSDKLGGEMTAALLQDNADRFETPSIDRPSSYRVPVAMVHDSIATRPRALHASRFLN